MDFMRFVDIILSTFSAYSSRFERVDVSSSVSSKMYFLGLALSNFACCCLFAVKPRRSWVYGDDPETVYAFLYVLEDNGDSIVSILTSATTAAGLFIVTRFFSWNSWVFTLAFFVCFACMADLSGVSWFARLIWPLMNCPIWLSCRVRCWLSFCLQARHKS